MSDVGKTGSRAMLQSKQCSVNKPEDKDLSTLVLTTIVFRHGDRTPDPQNTYPTNPYKNKTFFPYKLGELTMKGQTRMYNIGKYLRKRYDAFLGKTFYTDLVCSTSSSYTRCQMSLQAVHAGLFPPDVNNSIPGLAWQAIPYNIIPFEQDKYFSLQIYCPDVMDLVYPDEIDPEDRKLLDYIQNKSGYPKVEYLQALRIYDFTKTCVEAGLDVPDWVKPLWPDKLRTLALKFWYYFQTTRRRFGAGNLLRRITEDAQQKATGQLACGRKMYLYAGHDLNLQLLRGALGVWNDESVDYGAYLIFELHKIDGVYGFKIYYQNNYDQPKLLNLPDCESAFIPLDQFIDKTQYLYTPEVGCEEIEVPNKA